MLLLAIIFAFLLSCSAFFSGSETALFSLSDVELYRFRSSKNSWAKRLALALEKPRKILVTILLGNEFVNICISIVGALMIERVIHERVEIQTLLGVAIITPVIFVLGEILPKNIALRTAHQIAPILILPLQIIAKVVAPIRIVLTWLADRVVLLFGGDIESSDPMVMEEEYLRLVDYSHKSGEIDKEERELIRNVFEFSDEIVQGIMTSADVIFSLPISISFEDMVEEIKGRGLSRIPFYDGDSSDVVGILHVRDLLTYHRKRQAGEKVKLRSVLRKPLFVNPATPLEKLLKEFQRTHVHMAIVKDSKGVVVGIVTMDDVLEELFGEIEDEPAQLLKDVETVKGK
jgi:magnesium and cobalt exporter, CNNM family